MLPSLTTDEPTLLHEVFAAVARRHADRVAVDIPPSRAQPQRRCVTYAELQQQAGAVAAALHGLARRDAIVAVLLPRNTPALYAAQLGILQAGAAFACLDPAFPDEHLRRVLEDGGPVALLTDASGQRRIGALGTSHDGLPRPGTPGRGCERPTTDSLAPVLRGEGWGEGEIPAPAIIDVDALPTLAPSADPSGTHADPHRLAYVIYTSGTTGQPKGVLIEHGAS